MRRLRRRNHKRLAEYVWFNWYEAEIRNTFRRFAAAQEKFNRQCMEIYRDNSKGRISERDHTAVERHLPEDPRSRA